MRDLTKIAAALMACLTSLFAATYLHAQSSVANVGRVRTIGVGQTDVAQDNDQTIAWNSGSGGAKTQTIPGCGIGENGRTFQIKDEKGDAATNNITITAQSGTIDGNTSYVIGAAYGSVSLRCDGNGTSSNWMAVSATAPFALGGAGFGLTSATVLNGGASFATGDTLTLNIPGAVAAAPTGLPGVANLPSGTPYSAATFVVVTVSASGAILFVQPQGPSNYVQIPAQSAFATTATTTGAGVGGSFTVNFAPNAAYVLPPSQASGTSSNGNSFNTSYGLNALSSFTTGLENTAVGWGELSQLTTGSGNTFIGIGGFSLATGSDNVAVGIDAIRNGAANFDDVAIGRYSLEFPIVPLGNNTAIGWASMRGQAASTPQNNVAVGASAMTSANMTTAQANVAIGQGSLTTITSGFQNVVVGWDAGEGITSANSDTYVGAQAGKSGNGQDNTALGGQALGNASFSGGGNTALGFLSGHSITTGGFNVILGGSNVVNTTLSTGSRNIIIGTQSNCDAPSSGQNDYLGICESNGSTPLIQGGLATTDAFFQVNGDSFAGGTVPTPSGSCSVTQQKGGNWAGSFVAAGACNGTVILTFAATTTNGWMCDTHDQTTTADRLDLTASNASTATFTGTAASSDVISFKCIGY